MRKQDNPSRLIEDPAIAQRAIVLVLLSNDHDERWSRAEIERELYDVQPTVVNDAIESLKEGGVAHAADEHLWASQPVQHLNTLGIICA